MWARPAMRPSRCGSSARSATGGRWGRWSAISGTPSCRWASWIPPAPHLAESLGIFRALNDRDGVVYETFNLGLAEYLRGSPGVAEAYFAESLDLARRVQMKASIAYALIGLAMAGSGADGGRSARLHGAADQALAVLGETVEPLEGGPA